MSVFHQPADHLVQRALVGYVELFGVVGTLRLRIAANRRAGAAADLRDAQTQQAGADGLGFPGGNDHAAWNLRRRVACAWKYGQ